MKENLRSLIIAKKILLLLNNADTILSDLLKFCKDCITQFWQTSNNAKRQIICFQKSNSIRPGNFGKSFQVGQKLKIEEK